MKNQRALVIGLGKTGASAVRFLLSEGAQVAVTDTRADPPGLAEIRHLADVELRLGGFSSSAQTPKLAVLSPGVSPQEPFVRELMSARVDVVGDIELFARKALAPVIGITGANGKSTVTTLVGEMAKAAGLRVQSEAIWAGRRWICLMKRHSCTCWSCRVSSSKRRAACAARRPRS